MHATLCDIYRFNDQSRTGLSYSVLFLTVLLCLGIQCEIHADQIPRRVIAFWDKIVDGTVDDSLIHRTIEMPLNHLGLDVVYCDINEPLPDIIHRSDVRGVVLSFYRKTRIPDPKAFIDWAVEAINAGKKIVILRNSGLLEAANGEFTSVAVQNRLFEKIGFRNFPTWVDYPFDYHILKTDPSMTPFERGFPTPLPGFYISKVTAPFAKSSLRIGIPGKPESESDLVITSPYGGYIAEFYANSYDNLLFSSNPQSLGWYIDPFLFFERAFGLSSLPIPDTTTLAGRRIFLSTCHGDNWNGETLIEDRPRKRTTCAEIILERVIKPNHDIPIAVGVIAGDLDPKWGGKADSQSVAKQFFDLPQVENSTHTYSHPFFWDFFKEDGGKAEIDFLHLYPGGSWQNSFLSWFRAKSYETFNSKEFAKKRLKWGYVTPRTYANEPFELKKEIFGALDYLNQFAPPRDKIQLLLWSGDCRPWDTAVEYAYNANVANFGGGYVQMDPDHPSYLFVYPLGRKPGGWIQLYCTANGDIQYTDGWKDKFYGFQFLPETLKNTESPRRIKAITHYFHAFSGQFQPSINALLSNIAFIKGQSTIPLQIKRYCEIGKGFYLAGFEILGQQKWRIHQRYGLQTIRFDHASNLALDFNESTGIVGCCEFQGSLYVYLDAAEEAPIIALAFREPSSSIVKGARSYLIDSNWEIWGVKRNGSSIIFQGKGWGKLSMRWQMDTPGEYSIEAGDTKTSKVIVDNENVLIVEQDLPYNLETTIKITKQ